MSIEQQHKLFLKHGIRVNPKLIEKKDLIKVINDGDGLCPGNPSLDRALNNKTSPFHNLVMDLDVELRCINLTQLRGADKCD